MKAAVYVGAGSVELREWPRPSAGPGELLLKVNGCGLCGTDIGKILKGEIPPPMVFGHEVVGTVVDAGGGIEDYRVGDRLVVAHHVPCFTCHYCRRGSPSMCRTFKAMNLDSVMVIADEIDENLYLASRNLVNVLVVEPRYADPVSLVHYRKVLVTKAAVDKLKEMFA